MPYSSDRRRSGQLAWYQRQRFRVLSAREHASRLQQVPTEQRQRALLNPALQRRKVKPVLYIYLVPFVVIMIICWRCKSS